MDINVDIFKSHSKIKKKISANTAKLTFQMNIFQTQ